MNRIEMLREMGITPVWLPRKGVGSADGREPSVQLQTRELATPKNSVAPTSKPLGDNDFRGAGPESRMQQGSPVAGIGNAGPGAVREPVAVPADPDRAARIARMDWEQLGAAVAGCEACSLCKGRTHTVFGAGAPPADWMIIGEAPGQEEDRQGQPFVGQAGKLLDSMLAALDMRREVNIFIANVLKCRPPGNRNPEPGEMAQCAPLLLRQVELIAPKVLLLMGRFAVQSILATDASIASLRGRLHDYRGIPAVVTYHPAYLLRNLPDKAKAWEDLLFARKTMAQVRQLATAQEQAVANPSASGAAARPKPAS